MPWLHPMGFRFSFLFAAPLLLATPVFAQQEQDSQPVFNLPHEKSQTDANTANPDKQGPELDVFRGAPATVTPPPVVLPTIPVMPQPATPAPQPTQRHSTTPAPHRAPETAPALQAQPTPASPIPAPVPAAPTPAPQAAPLPAPATNAAPAAEAPPLAPPAEKPLWPWIAGAVGLIAAIAAALWLRRPKRVEAEWEAESPPSEPAPEPAPLPAPRPASTAPAPVQTDRPWLDLVMEVQAARLTLMGATIGYALTVHNRGTRAADDVLIRSMIANADAQQQPLFQQFFAGESGLPVHSTATIAPGETQRLTGEVRLGAQEVAAIPMGQRALLIPLIAFDAQYRWTNEAGETQGMGRTGRAFIVGEEQTPPVERLSPFRLDLGPRQYRAPGSRATALTLES